MAFSRDDLAAYEKQPQKQIDDKVSPFRGATPARAADPAAVAAVQSGQQVDATPGGATQVANSAPLTDDDAPVVDEDGTLGDPTESGEGTSDDNSADSSTAAVDPGNDSDPNTDLTGDTAAEEDATGRPAPKKGSAAERIVELNDLMEGYKVFGKQMQDMARTALEENARLRAGGTPTTGTTTDAALPVVDAAEEPMPDMADEDVAFDNDKYRAKMAKWMKAQTAAAARQAISEVTGATSQKKLLQDVSEKCEAFAKDHPDFEEKVGKNPVLATNKLGPDASAVMVESEHTAALLYKFGNDHALAIRVARQSPRQQVVTVTNMIRDIEDERKANPKPNGQRTAVSQPGAKPGQKKSITQAPPPPRPTTGGGRAEGRTITDPNMSMDEFARQHRAGKQSARESSRKMRGLN
jgi:hypothetical protein